MADVSFTAANVTVTTSAIVDEGTAGATVTAGQVLYNSTANGRLILALNDTAAHANAVGHALHGAASGQPLKFIRSGALTLGGGLTKGKSYFVSPNAGAISDSTGVASTRYRTFLGIATSTTVLLCQKLVSGVTSS